MITLFVISCYYTTYLRSPDFRVHLRRYINNYSNKQLNHHRIFYAMADRPRPSELARFVHHAGISMSKAVMSFAQFVRLTCAKMCLKIK